MATTTTPGFWDDAEVISTYTRAQALADGVLVALDGAPELAALCHEAGVKVPIAATARVYAECIALTEAATRAGNDVKGRLWDVLWMMRAAMRRTRGGGSALTFTVRVVRERVRPTPTVLIAKCGPGDAGEPVLTLMYPGED